MTASTEGTRPAATVVTVTNPDRSFRISRSSPESTAGLIGFGLVLALLVSVPWLDGAGGIQTRLVVLLYYLSLAQMWNLLAGFAGLVSVGQQMFVGIGIYTLLQVAEVGGLDPFLAVLVSGVVAAALSLPVALFAFRLKGGYFAIGTWVVAEVFRLLTMESSQLRGGDVRSLTRQSLGGYSLDTRTNVVYWLSLALAVGATAIIVLVLRSRLGLALRAVRDSEEGARGLGVDVTRTRVAVWVLAAFWTGCTGADILLNTSSTTAGSGFSVLRWTALVIFIVVIGGIGSTTGPIIGIVVFWLVDDQLADAENWRFIVLGVIAAVIAITAPGGLYGLLQRWRPLQFFPVRPRLVSDRGEEE
jgi:branched-chain amino acid transport system permease protein